MFHLSMWGMNGWDLILFSNSKNFPENKFLPVNNSKKSLDSRKKTHHLGPNVGWNSVLFETVSWPVLLLLGLELLEHGGSICFHGFFGLSHSETFDRLEHLGGATLGVCLARSLLDVEGILIFLHDNFQGLGGELLLVLFLARPLGFSEHVEGDSFVFFVVAALLEDDVRGHCCLWLFVSLRIYVY